MTKKFTTKDPEEVIIISFDYTDMLDTSETITGIFAWEIEVSSGTDLTPSALFTGSPTYGAKVTSRFITGGIDGNSYLISCIVDTTTGQRLKLSGILPIVRQV